MTATAASMLNMAKSQLSFREGRNNANPYWRWSPRDPWLANAKYCASALTWCAWKVGALDIMGGGFYNCANWVNNWKRRGQWRSWQSVPRPGDIVFFDWSGRHGMAQHVGIVTGWDPVNKVVLTIEFNTSAGLSGSQSDGGGCYRRRRNPLYVVGYGRPSYRPATTTTLPRASRDNPRRLPPLVIDGVWGRTTTSRTMRWIGVRVDTAWSVADRKAFQRKLGVPQDGVWGPVTRKRLQRLVGVPQDGVWGPLTVKAFQRYLNRHVLS